MAGSKNFPHGAGRSSFDLIDQDTFFAALGLKGTETLVDLGCGRGNYALPLARRLPQGTVWAVDLWEEGLEDLKARAYKEKLTRIQVLRADISQPLPLPAESVDVVLMATVLHDLAEAGEAPGALAETARLLKPQGRLAVVEFQKIPGPPGPPVEIRLSSEDTLTLAAPYGLTQRAYLELGPYLYLLILTKNSG
jgi:ubiquinone/menaquinone biosynthesis C-methylase UbiE